MRVVDDGQDQSAAAKLDTSIPQTARIWNYWLGGKDNVEADRIVGDEIRASYPEIVVLAQEQRNFLVRVVTYLAAEAGVRQFLDIGTGLPTANNTHQVAQSVAPDSCIVYVDNDPLVLAYARALLTSTPEGVTAYVDADMYDTDLVLREAARTLDFSRPVAVLFMGVLGHVRDDSAAREIAGAVVNATPSGSYLVVCDATSTSAAVVEAARIWNLSAAPQYHLRTPARLTRFFEGLELVEPGLVPTTRWRPTEAKDPIDQYGAVGRKP